MRFNRAEGNKDSEMSLEQQAREWFVLLDKTPELASHPFKTFGKGQEVDLEKFAIEGSPVFIRLGTMDDRESLIISPGSRFSIRDSHHPDYHEVVPRYNWFLLLLVNNKLHIYRPVSYGGMSPGDQFIFKIYDHEGLQILEWEPDKLKFLLDEAAQVFDGYPSPTKANRLDIIHLGNTSGATKKATELQAKTWTERLQGMLPGMKNPATKPV